MAFLSRMLCMTYSVGSWIVLFRMHAAQPLAPDPRPNQLLYGAYGSPVSFGQSGVCYSPPMRAPFSATERFMISTSNTSAAAVTARTQNTSK